MTPSPCLARFSGRRMARARAIADWREMLTGNHQNAFWPEPWGFRDACAARGTPWRGHWAVPGACDGRRRIRLAQHVHKRRQRVRKAVVIAVHSVAVGRRPVRKEVRDGLQMGAWQYARRNRTLRDERCSSVGVRRSEAATAVSRVKAGEASVEKSSSTT